MSKRPYDNVGFMLASETCPGDANRLRTVARFRCVECGTTADAVVKTGFPLDPEGLAKRMRQSGWECHAFKRTNTNCPKCVGARKVVKNDTDSELRKVVPMTTAPAIVRDITPSQRFEIRSLLDKHFDDKAGMYLDNVSDQTIAEKLDVPRIQVERIREAAYGPIKIDAATVELRASVAALRKEIETQESAIDQLKSRLTQIEAKAKIARAA